MRSTFIPALCSAKVVRYVAQARRGPRFVEPRSNKVTHPVRKDRQGAELTKGHLNEAHHRLEICLAGGPPKTRLREP